MMSIDDESSRDSGICDMNEDAPTCFSSLQSTFGSNAMEIEESTSSVVVRITPKRQKRTVRRRETSSSCFTRRPLFNQPPTSGSQLSLPVCPSGLSLRHPNQEKTFFQLDQRKRTFNDQIEEMVPSKQRRHIGSDDVTEVDMDQEIHEVRERTSTSTEVRRVAHSSEEFDGSHLVVAYHLKTTSTVCSTSYRRITAETLIELIQELGNGFTRKYVLIDCRYEFEYNGGHVKNAINFFDRDTVPSLFFDEFGNRRFQQTPIFYCEFSQKRGPNMAAALRKEDRKRNVSRYPNCSYEEMYVLDKGYRNFFKLAKSLNVEGVCEPFSYVEMTDSKYMSELKKWNYHRRASTAQTVMKNESQESFFISSFRSFQIQASASQKSTKSTDSSTPPGRGEQNSFQRTRSLNDRVGSPTNYSRPNLGSLMSSPQPSNAQITNPQFS